MTPRDEVRLFAFRKQVQGAREGGIVCMSFHMLPRKNGSYNRTQYQTEMLVDQKHVGLSPFVLGAGNIATITTYIRAGGDLYAQDREGNPPLHVVRVLRRALHMPYMYAPARLCWGGLHPSWSLSLCLVTTHSACYVCTVDRQRLDG